MNTFIRLGSRGFSTNDIVGYDLNYTRREPVIVDGSVVLNQEVAYVKLVTREQTYTDVGADGYIGISAEYLFKHDTPEANALVTWLADQSTDLLDSTPRFYVTSNFYGGHIASLAAAALANNAELLAVDSVAVKDLDECGYRVDRSFYLFLVKAPTLQEARDTVEHIQAVADSMEG